MCHFIDSSPFSLLARSGSTEVAEEPVYSATTDAVAEFAYDHQSRINHNPLFRNDDEDTHESKEGGNGSPNLENVKVSHGPRTILR